MTAVTPTDRPKSVRNSCVIKVFGGVFVLSGCFFDFCGCRGFCHRTESDLFLFLFFSFTSTYQPARLTKDTLLLNHIDTLTKIVVKMDNYELPTFYW